MWELLSEEMIFLPHSEFKRLQSAFAKIRGVLDSGRIAAFKVSLYRFHLTLFLAPVQEAQCEFVFLVL